MSVPDVAPPPSVAPPSSSGKWIVAGVVLALMVFGITYALTTFGVSNNQEPDVIPDKGGANQQLKLTFLTTKQPPQDDGDPTKSPPPLDVEAKKEVPGVDFWFENKNDKPVTIGLFDTSCGCMASTQVYLLPSGSKMAPGQEANLEKMATVSTLKRRTDDSVSVAPQQVGWVRMAWKSDNKPLVSLTLWLNSLHAGQTEILEARLQYHEPLKVIEKMQPFESIDASKLPRTISIRCWSVTRDSLKLTTRVLGGREGTVEPLVIGQPKRIDEKEYTALAPLLKERTLGVVYDVPITLRGQTEDGKPIDAGPFRRRVELQLDGEARDTKIVEVVGEIQGDVQVQGATAGRVDLGSFRAKDGSRDVVLRLTSEQTKKLEVDRTRTADFLKAELTPGPEEAATTWQLKVSVKKNEAIGRFPRHTPEEYRDSAVYVRPAGDSKARATRIPVEGSATD